jgi:antibiotic biosynthesis monooxygenase (ABM) superfamily enzyme
LLLAAVVVVVGFVSLSVVFWREKRGCHGVSPARRNSAELVLYVLLLFFVVVFCFFLRSRARHFRFRHSRISISTNCMTVLLTFLVFVVVVVVVVGFTTKQVGRCAQ